MVGAVTEVVKATFRICKKTTGSGAHAIAIGSFDNVGGGREGSSADGVVFGSGPESKDHEIGFLGLPPEWVADVGGGRPENGRGGIVWRV